MKYLYKIDYVDGTLNSTNLIYAPSMKDNVLCMDFADDGYHKNPLSTKIRDYFFEREIFNLEKFKDYVWCPKVLDIQGKKIFVEFGKETLNNIVLDKTRDIDHECVNWQEQIRSIVDDIKQQQYYKVTLYPHCFFILNGTIKTIDFYGCVTFEDRMMPLDIIREMIGKDSVDRFTEATVGNTIDFEIFYNRLLTHHLFKYWPKLF
jgi:hypothetical protein